MGWEPWNPTSLSSAAGAGNSHQTSLDHKCSILDNRLRERGPGKHGHNCSSVSVKTHLSQKMLWTRCFWAKARLGLWLDAFISTLNYWGCGSSWPLLLKLDSSFLILNTSENLFWKPQMRLDGSTDPYLLSEYWLLLPSSMPQQPPPQGSPLTCCCIFASWLSSHWNNCPENQNTAFKDTPFVFADHVKKTMTQKKSYLPLKLETSQTN